MKHDLNSLCKKLYEESGLSFAKLAEEFNEVSGQSLHNWATGKCYRAIDVRLLDELTKRYTEREIIDGIRASAKALRNRRTQDK